LISRIKLIVQEGSGCLKVHLSSAYLPVSILFSQLNFQFPTLFSIYFNNFDSSQPFFVPTFGLLFLSGKRLGRGYYLLLFVCEFSPLLVQLIRGRASERPYPFTKKIERHVYNTQKPFRQVYLRDEQKSIMENEMGSFGI